MLWIISLPHNIINSAKFPIVIFKRAPAVSPRSCERFSVAKVRVIDKGMIEIKFQINTSNVGASAAEKRIAMAEKAKANIFFGASRIFPWCLNARMGLLQMLHSGAEGKEVLGFEKSFLK